MYNFTKQSTCFKLFLISFLYRVATALNKSNDLLYHDLCQYRVKVEIMVIIIIRPQGDIEHIPKILSSVCIIYLT